MKFISHRGNINSKNPNRENSFDYILEALNRGFDVEIDIWYTEDGWFLGHDEPTYKIDPQKFMLYHDKLWFHCKNLQAMEKITKFDYQYFWHQTDDFTLTSKGFIWTYPNKPLTNRSICVLPEKHFYNKKELYSCYGICSDFIENY